MAFSDLIFGFPEKVTKVCNADGQWFRHPDSNRLWSNYTLCSAYTHQKVVVRSFLYILLCTGILSTYIKQY